MADTLFNFIRSNSNSDTIKLHLSGATRISNFSEELTELIPEFKKFEIPSNFILTQIESRRHTADKLKPFISKIEFLFPTKISAEQSSDYRVAMFNSSAGSLLDMTAGLGIDAMTSALTGAKVTAIELDPLKAAILEYNQKLINLNMEVICADCTDYLRKTDRNFDTIFIDPARRTVTGKRTYGFSDCEPDILPILDLMKRKASQIKIKASPMLDITGIIRQIPDITYIYIVCVKGECKEILIVIDANDTEPEFVVVDLDSELSDEHQIKVRSYFKTTTYNSCLKPRIFDAVTEKDLSSFYLYEPNAGVMKLNAGGALCQKFPELYKASKNTNVYLSSVLYPQFPGRILKIEKDIKKEDYKILKGSHFNIVSRNYPLSPQQIAKKTGIKDGGDQFLYAIRLGMNETPIQLTAHIVNPDLTDR